MGLSTFEFYFPLQTFLLSLFQNQNRLFFFFQCKNLSLFFLPPRHISSQVNPMSPKPISMFFTAREILIHTLASCFTRSTERPTSCWQQEILPSSNNGREIYYYFWDQHELDVFKSPNCIIFVVAAELVHCILNHVQDARTNEGLIFCFVLDFESVQNKRRASCAS